MFYLRCFLTQKGGSRATHSKGLQKPSTARQGQCEAETQPSPAEEGEDACLLEGVQSLRVARTTQTDCSHPIPGLILSSLSLDVEQL